MVKTHRDYLIENHGLGPQWNPRVECACGRETSADMCVDLTPLPLEYRRGLGLELVDYLCDGCITRLFREQFVNEDEFYALLGQDDVDALYTHNDRDRDHVNGLAERQTAQQPGFARVTSARVMGRSVEEITRERPIIPLKCREMRHQQSAQYLAYKYTLTNVEQPPDRVRELLAFDAIDLATGEMVRGQPSPELLEVEGETSPSVAEPDVDISPAT
jgi:hypothetical protein